jgi:alpha-D-ribose 1-methylphosphonate 5-phosphate C-P lyase
VEVHVQTYDGDLDADGRWVADAKPVADFVVPAGSSKRQNDALMFVTAPEEIRILAPIQRSYLIDITADLGDDDDWTVPSEVCEGTPTA